MTARPIWTLGDPKSSEFSLYYRVINESSHLFCCSSGRNPLFLILRWELSPGAHLSQCVQRPPGNGGPKMLKKWWAKPFSLKTLAKIPINYGGPKTFMVTRNARFRDFQGPSDPPHAYPVCWHQLQNLMGFPACHTFSDGLALHFWWVSIFLSHLPHFFSRSSFPQWFLVPPFWCALHFPSDFPIVPPFCWTNGLKKIYLVIDNIT